MIVFFIFFFLRYPAMILMRSVNEDKILQLILKYNNEITIIMKIVNLFKQD